MLAMKPVVLKFVLMRAPFWDDIMAEDSKLYQQSVIGPQASGCFGCNNKADETRENLQDVRNIVMSFSTDGSDT